jgi:two-component system OmpR family response regulator
MIHIPRALIVDDSPETGIFIQQALARIPVIGICETHGRDALRRFQQINPALVLLDLNLPDMSGWEVLDAIKESRPEARRPAIIIITAYGEPANRLKGRLQGVDAFLVKPFSIEELQRTTEDVLRQRKERGSL